MTDVLLHNSAALSAALAGAIVAGVYVGALWRSAATTVRSRSLKPFAVGITVRLVLLCGSAATLVLLGAVPTSMLSFFAAFLAVRWLLVRQVREAQVRDQEIAR